MPRRQPAIATIAIALIAGAGACSDSRASPRPNPPATSSVSTSPVPSREEEAAAAAVAVFEEWAGVYDTAAGAPADQDWEPEIRQYSTDPAASNAVEGVADLVELGIKLVGATQVEPEVTDVDLDAEGGPIVSISACYDKTNADLVFTDSGQSIVPPGAPAELDRLVWLVTVVQMQEQPGTPWLVRTQDAQPDVPC